MKTKVTKNITIESIAVSDTVYKVGDILLGTPLESEFIDADFNFGKDELFHIISKDHVISSVKLYNYNGYRYKGFTIITNIKTNESMIAQSTIVIKEK